MEVLCPTGLSALSVPLFSPFCWLPAATAVLFQPEARLFFAVGAREVSVVDCDLNVVEQIDGLKTLELVQRFLLARAEGAAKIGG